MRLTVDLLNRAEQRTNCLGERELVLSGLAIPAIENTAALLASEGFDCVDLSNNLLVRLENFSRWHRLSNLLASGNRIEGIDARNVQQNIPNLQSLTLSYNQISSLAEIKAIGSACQFLTFLDLTGNPVTQWMSLCILCMMRVLVGIPNHLSHLLFPKTGRPHYRLYAIHHIPSLRCLDCTKVKRTERQRATRLFQSAAGAALEHDVLSDDVKTFTPGESADGSAARTLFTAEERDAIRQLLANAASVQEVEAIENAVQRGVLPEPLRSNTTPAPPANKRLKIV